MPKLMRRLILIVSCVGLGILSADLHAQNIPGNGWSSFGILPFRGYDYVIVQAPTQYILYFQLHIPGTPESAADQTARAFSTDLKHFTLDTNNVCANSGDLCNLGPRSGVLTLPDGRMRMFMGKGSLSSAISTDGIVWTREPGVRFTADSNSIYERGNFVLALSSYVYLPDGSVRMYYEGGIAPGSPGTPAYYNSIFDRGTIMSAISKDNGLTWVREPGVRINPIVQGPASASPTQTQFDGNDVTAVAVKENGNTVYRIYSQSLTDGAVSYISQDGLTFALEGQLPTDRGDPKAVVMKDGRVWLLTNGPDAVNDTLVYGPQSVFVKGVKANNTISPVTHFPAFQSATIGVTGTSGGLVTLQAAAGSTKTCFSPPCAFHPEYYLFSPASGKPPFSSVMSYAGPSDYQDFDVYVHAAAPEVTAVGGVFCMGQLLGSQGSEVFCKTTTPPLPMTQMNVSFSVGAAAVSRTSGILSLGGQGYPFAVSSSVPWATVSPASGTAPMNLTVRIDPTGLAAGTYNGVITISAEGTTEQITVNAVVSPGPVITALQNAASGDSTIAPNSFMAIYGSGFAGSPTSWNPVTSLPTSLGGVSVRVNGKDAYLSYADSGQLNLLTPTDTTSGSVQVQVTTGSGTTTANAIMAQAGPAWFTYTTGGPTWIAALIANTATYVAPAGTFGPGASRSAKAGDYLALYANGLGATNPAAPVGVVLTTDYPLDDLSRVTITIGGHNVPVLYAGLVGAGLYQINVQVPPGLGTGELPVMMMVSGQPTQDGVTLNFQ